MSEKEQLTGNAVQQVSRPPMMTPTGMPEELVDLASANGYRLSWQQDKGELESMLAGQGIEPFEVDVHLKSWDPDMHKQFKAGKALTRIRSLLKQDGRIHNYDTVICVQPQEAYDEHMEMVRAMEQARVARHDDGSELEELKHNLEKLGIKTVASRNEPISDSVYIGKEPSTSSRGSQ